MKSRGVKHFIHLIDERKINFVTKKQLTQSTLQKRYNHAQIALLLLFLMIITHQIELIIVNCCLFIGCRRGSNTIRFQPRKHITV